MPSAFIPNAGTNVADGAVSPAKISTDFGGFFRNKILNGNFDIAQRGTSFSTPATGVYGLDRWVPTYDGTIGAFTLSQQAFTVGQTAVPNEPTSFMRWNQTSGGSGSAFRRIEQRIEDVRTLAGKHAVLTIYAKADTTRNMTVALVQGFGSGGSADVSTSMGTLALTASWQKFVVECDVPSISGKTLGAGNSLALRLGLPINTTMTIDVAQVQLEEKNASPFEQRPFALEQSLCERFYQVAPTRVGTADTAIPFKASMRAAPTVAGGGSGFATATLTANGGYCSQSSAADQNLTLEAEL